MKNDFDKALFSQQENDGDNEENFAPVQKKKKRSIKPLIITLIVIVVAVIALTAAVNIFIGSKISLLNFENDGNKNTINMYNNNIANILVLGTDEREDEYSDSARSDSMMMVSVNKSKGSVKLVSFERATEVPIPGQSNDLLTHAFAYGGANLVIDNISKLYDVNVKRYVRVNFNTFQTIINSIGGIQIEITKEEDEYLQKYGIMCGGAGVVTMDGFVALTFARARQLDSDWHRVERQRKVILAILDKVKQMSILEINNLIDKVLPLISTNMTGNEIRQLIKSIPSFLSKDIKTDQMTLPLAGTYRGVKINGLNMYRVDFDINAKALKEFLQGTPASELVYDNTCGDKLPTQWEEGASSSEPATSEESSQQTDSSSSDSGSMTEEQQKEVLDVIFGNGESSDSSDSEPTQSSEENSLEQ